MGINYTRSGKLKVAIKLDMSKFSNGNIRLSLREIYTNFTNKFKAILRKKLQLKNLISRISLQNSTLETKVGSKLKTKFGLFCGYFKICFITAIYE